MAAKVDLPIEQVTLITNYYWAEVRQQLSSLSSVRVHLTNLGDFSLKHWLLQRERERYLNVQNYLQREGKLTNSELVAAKIQAIDTVSTLYQAEQQRKSFIKQHKQQTHESTPPALEEP